ncbi:S1C family serine protease [Globicatella sanguinis]|uniref:S1C family serine protease n=1 Tax=Globicatella sanguinis TaxID=13076 RepID=UPI0025436175|nr:trypsin-like peptidase domain-containing protein [Globicatella sanguinis]MDK7629908.1 trypsin-like peptidase domain-containing protein [Globicatella sanguinis]WIK65807.1 trypsin-like peptidase domain-containing protein [Globicatella sanguinis]WKT55212.1 trypsin-like peptidase domain-containing protein [Globicatella sanguinis]
MDNKKINDDSKKIIPMNSNKKDNPFWKSVFGGILGSAIIIGMVFLLAFNGLFQSSETMKAYSQESDTNSQTLTDFESAIMGAVEKTGDAVVSVNNLQSQHMNQIGNYGFGYGYSSNSQGTVDLQDPEQSLELYGTGSGVVYKIEGDTAYIVTNNHVVDGADKLQIITAEGDTVDAELVGTDVFTDLAVLKVSSEKLKTAITFADSDQLKVGSLAIAIGSPLGSEFSSSVTQGIVSGTDRVVPFDMNDDGEDDWEMNLIQTDAAINPGNSGGALINKNGELIGINSSKLSSTEIEGMGFAIPSNDVQNVISQLEENGKVTRPVLGVSYLIPVNQLSARSKVEVLGLAEDAEEGVVVSEVVSGTAADKAGMEKYDVITEFDGVAINGMMDLRKELYKHQAGDQVELTIIRRGETQKLTITLEVDETTQQN